MRLGIGTPAQKSALLKAGAEKVLMHHEIDGILEGKMRQMVFRPGDIVILAQANLLDIKAMKAIAGEGPSFELIGHGPCKITTDQSVAAFRRKKPLGVKVKIKDGRGAKTIWAPPTKEQLETIVTWWQTPEIKRSVLVERVRNLLEQDVPDHWVRDQIIKATGSAKRSPVEK